MQLEHQGGSAGYAADCETRSVAPPMSCRISGGTLKGRVVSVPDVAGVRPTAGIVREALFSMIGQDLAGTTTVDLFGGSGLMAFEFCSRGSQVQVVEKNAKVAAAIRENARKLSVNLEVQVGDARKFRSASAQPIDHLFMDPPYADRPLDWLEVAGKLGAMLTILEHRTGAELPAELHGMVLIKRKTYGDSSLALFQRRPTAGSPEV